MVLPPVLFDPIGLMHIKYAGFDQSHDDVLCSNYRQQIARNLGFLDGTADCTRIVDCEFVASMQCNSDRRPLASTEASPTTKTEERF